MNVFDGVCNWIEYTLCVFVYLDLQTAQFLPDVFSVKSHRIKNARGFKHMLNIHHGREKMP